MICNLEISTMSIFWAEGPLRPHANPGPDSWSCPADGSTYFVRILGDPVPVWLHWLEQAKRTVPCTGHECDYCPKIRQQWKGYAPALVFDTGSSSWKSHIIELTENARDELLKDEFRAIVQWRGTVIKMSRVANVVHAKVEDREIKAPLPETWDIKPTLVRMWQIRSGILPARPGHALFSQT